jgi:prepilin-type processing-associated H-X9-DG protein
MVRNDATSLNRDEADDLNSVLGTGQFKLNDPTVIAAGNGPADEGFSSVHAGGAHFAMADGGVRFISEAIDHTGTPRTVCAYTNATGGTSYIYYHYPQTPGAPYANQAAAQAACNEPDMTPPGTGIPYGVYQRLFSKADGLSLGEF